MEERSGALRRATAAAVTESPGVTPPPLRQAVARGEPPEELRALVEKIRRHAWRVTDADLDALRARYSEDALFEIIVSATVGAAEARLQAGLRALTEAHAAAEDRKG